MPDFTLRKTALFLEDIHHDGGPPTDHPRRRAAIAALVANPFAGSYTADLQPAMEDLKPLGLMMTDRLIKAMGGDRGIDGYGKAAIAGADGELEHTALWHVPGGYAMQAYDAAMLIDSAVAAVDGDLSDKDAVRAALEAADFTSLRGDFSFNTNHYPKQDFYQLAVKQREDGAWITSIGDLVFENYGDSFAEECNM